MDVDPPDLPPPLPNDPPAEEEEEEGGGYTAVYAAPDESTGKRKSTSVGTSTGDSQQFYAVRAGLTVSNCVFFRWEDAAPHITQPDGTDSDAESDVEVEYDTFDDITDAWAYIAAGNNAPEIARPRKRSKKSLSSSSAAAASSSAERDGGKTGKIWDVQYNELVQFKAKNGHCLVPSKKGEETKLSRWVSRQRLEYRYFQEGKPTAMTQERVDRLVEIGFAFKAWDAKREANMTGASGSSGATGAAAAAAKPAAAAAIMMSPPGTKAQRFAHQFDLQYVALVQYKAENSTCDVPGNHPTLGKWVQQIRSLCKKKADGKNCDPLTDEQYNRLVSVDFVMKARRGPKGGRRKDDDEDSNANWETMYEKMQEFKTQNGHCNVPQTPYTSLRGWVIKQRNEYKRLRNNESSNLSARRLQQLNDLDFEWNNKKTLKWSERYEQLRKFKEKHGHCIVPRNYEEDDAAGLGKWIAQQRHAYKQMNEGKSSTMTNERAKQFNDLGMVWSILKQPVSRAERMPWEDRFQQLLEYKEKNGDTVVPQKYPGGLGNWVHQQRTHYMYMNTGRKSMMTAEKVKKLKDIGFEFAVKKTSKVYDPKSSTTDVDLSVARAVKAGALKKSDTGEYEPAVAAVDVDEPVPPLPDADEEELEAETGAV